MAIFNSYVKLPEGMVDFPHWTVSLSTSGFTLVVVYQRDLVEITRFSHDTLRCCLGARVVELSEFLRNIVELSELVFPQKNKFLIFWV
jgi:hypothetical protein